MKPSAALINLGSELEVHARALGVWMSVLKCLYTSLAF